MTIIGSISTPRLRPWADLGLRRAATAIGVHTIVDFFSFIIYALMPLLAVRLDMSRFDKAMIISIGTITSGLIQPAVAWATDRYDSRVFGTIGFAIAIACICSFGFVHAYWQLLILQAIGAAGIGAFHPPAVASVGSLAGRRRSRFVAIFYLAGMIGGISGNVLVPIYVDRVSHWAGAPHAPDIEAGLRSLIAFLIPGLVGIALLSWAIHRVSHRAANARDDHARLSPDERSMRWRAVGVLYASNVLRFVTNMAMVYLLVEWSTFLAVQRADAAAHTDAVGLLASRLNGPLQGAQQVGMGLGGIMLGLLLPVRFEKRAFLIMPWLGGLAIAAIPLSAHLPSQAVMPVAFAITAVAGLGCGSLIPVSIALAQRLLPHRTSLASGLMMGGAWSIAFLGPHIAGALQTHFGLEQAFRGIGIVLALAGVLAVFLPADVLQRSAE